jgi:hypothetical protein
MSDITKDEAYKVGYANGFSRAKEVIITRPLEKKERQHTLEALRTLAKVKCIEDNCGTVCLCPPCHARAALSTLDPEWNP